MTNNQKRVVDKYLLDTPEEGFSPERNKAIVEESIRKYEALRAKKWKQAMEANRERAEASVSFLSHADRTKNGRLDKYFDKKTISYLRGDEIFSDIRQLMLSNKLRSA